MSIQALILVGGLGTRLRPAIGDVPKPMAQIGGRPFLSYLLCQVREAGLSDVLLLTGHGREHIEQYFGSGSREGLAIAYSAEPAPLGTGGALRHALPRLSGSRFLLMNGDSFFTIDLRAFLAAADGPATLALARVPDGARYGSVRMDAAGRVTQFTEKAEGAAPGAPPREPTAINAGIYVLERSVIEAIPAARPVSLERDILPAWIGRGLGAIELTGAFVDIGVPDAYEQLRRDPSPLTALCSQVEAARS
jgi:NDP-sugar pyrophosphorylase family protein